MNRFLLRSSHWSMVPRVLSDDLTRRIAYFDMDDVGDNPCIAAGELWGSIVDDCRAIVSRLEFSNPIFHSGINTTFRRGEKWLQQNLAIIEIDGIDLYVPISCTSYKFYQLSDHHIKDEHDPECRTIEGLFRELARVYPGFSRSEYVTKVDFELPFIDKRQAP